MLEVLVDFEDFGAVDGLRVFGGGGAADRDVAGGVVAGQVADVELVLESDLDCKAGDCDAADGGYFGVDAGCDELG